MRSTLYLQGSSCICSRSSPRAPKIGTLVTPSCVAPKATAQSRAPPVRYRACTRSASDDVSELPGTDDVDELFELSVAMLSGHTVELPVFPRHTIYHVREELRSLDGKTYTLIAPGLDKPSTDAQTLLELGVGPEANCLFATTLLGRMRCEHCNIRSRLDSSLIRRRLEHCSGLHCGEWDERARRWSCCAKSKRGSPGCAVGHLHSWVPGT